MSTLSKRLELLELLTQFDYVDASQITKMDYDTDDVPTPLPNVCLSVPIDDDLVSNMMAQLCKLDTTNSIVRLNGRILEVVNRIVVRDLLRFRRVLRGQTNRARVSEHVLFTMLQNAGVTRYGARGTWTYRVSDEFAAMVAQPEITVESLEYQRKEMMRLLEVFTSLVVQEREIKAATCPCESLIPASEVHIVPLPHVQHEVWILRNSVRESEGYNPDDRVTMQLRWKEAVEDNPEIFTGRTFRALSVILDTEAMRNGQLYLRLWTFDCLVLEKYRKYLAGEQTDINCPMVFVQVRSEDKRASVIIKSMKLLREQIESDPLVDRTTFHRLLNFNALCVLPGDRRFSTTSTTSSMASAHIADSTAKICLLVGPPATGKTFSIVSTALRQIATMCGGELMFLTAETGYATKELAGRLHEACLAMPQESRPDLIHVVSPIQALLLSSATSRIGFEDGLPRSWFTTSISTDSEDANLADAVQRHFWNEVVGLFNREKPCMIVLTLSMFSVVPTERRGRKLPVKWLIIDEGGQVTVPTLLSTVYPLMNDSPSLKVLIAGDPQQLQPYRKTTGIAGEYLLGTSAMGVLLNQGVPSILLTEQQRCRGQIRAIWSNTFYGGRVLDSPRTFLSQRDSTLAATLDQAFGGTTAVSYSIVSPDAEAVKSTSKRSQCEAILAETLFKDAIAAASQCGLPHDANPLSAKVLCLYLGQVEEMRRRIGSENVETVDASQGHEYDLVIICVTNSRPSTFVVDGHRINVAISRPRLRLHVIITKSVADTPLWQTILGGLSVFP